jgi:NCS1 family nucleobase:cation symporter-1
MRKTETAEAAKPARLGPSPEQLTAHGISPRFYNADLAPARKEGRSWTAYSVFSLWANDVHSLGNYGFALGLFALGLGAWQILVALLVGAALLFFLLTLSGFMGYKTGVPYPVMSRISFGVHGAQLAASVRGIVAIAWFGIQTYLASSVLNVLLLTIIPGLQPWADAEFLGLSGLGWFSFSLLWIVQVIIVSYGMEMIRRYEAIAGPIILVTFLALAIWMLVARRTSPSPGRPMTPCPGGRCGCTSSAAPCGWPSTAPSCSTSPTSPGPRRRRGRSSSATSGASR